MTPALEQLGAAVVIVWMILQIIKAVLEFAGKGKSPIAIKVEADPATAYRLNKLDSEMVERVTRTEYESRHRDMQVQLGRIEQKLDDILRVRSQT